MTNENRLIIQSAANDNYSKHETASNNRKTKYIILALFLFIAVFIYDVSPLDLLPLLPFDDIAVTFGGTIGMIALLMKFFAKTNKKK